MYRNVLVLAGIALSLPSFAQETQSTLVAPPSPRNEIGTFHNSVISSGSDNSLLMAGVMYKRWVKPNTAYRTLASYARYSIHTVTPSARPASGDTVYSVFSNTNVNMAFIGGGVEMQRHFYRKVYLFAALEVRGGTGTGFTDEMEAKQYREPGSTYYSTADLRLLPSGSSVSMTYVGFVPTIGGKFQFNKVSFGAELSPLELSYRSTNTNGNTTGLADFNLGTFSNRFFINFRF